MDDVGLLCMLASIIILLLIQYSCLTGCCFYLSYELPGSMVQISELCSDSFDKKTEFRAFNSNLNLQFEFCCHLCF